MGRLRAKEQDDKIVENVSFSKRDKMLVLKGIDMTSVFVNSSRFFQIYLVSRKLTAR